MAIEMPYVTGVLMGNYSINEDFPLLKGI